MLRPSLISMRFRVILCCALFYLPCAKANPLYCFESEGSGSPIRFSWRFPEDGQTYGHVRYEKGAQDILVKNIVWQEANGNDNDYLASIGRPFEFESVWQEYVGKNKQGIYRLTTQGARIYSMTYQKSPRSKVIAFKEAQEECVFNQSSKNIN